MSGNPGAGPRVGHVCRKFAKPSETFILQTVRELERAGVDTRVYTRRRMGVPEAGGPEVTVYPESPLERVRFGVSKCLLKRYRLRFPVDRMAADLRAHRRTILHAHFGGTALAAAPVALAAGLPLVATFHAFDLYTRCFPPEVYRDLWPVLDRALAISDAGAERLRSHFGCPPEKIVRIHCGIDLERFLYRPPRADTGTVEMVGIGRLVPKKGVEVLLEALARMDGRAGLPTWRLSWYGEGAMRGALLRITRRLGIADRVRFPGGVPHDRVPGILRNADVLTLPSRTAANGDTEGIPITLLEAQATGCEVVATRHGGIPEGMPTAFHGDLVEEGDAEALAATLTERLRHQSEWPDRAKLGRKHVERHFSQQAESRALRNLYEEVGG